MARKTVLVSDIDGTAIDEARGGKLRLTFTDGRRQTVEWDVTGEETELQPLLDRGRRVQRRGRKPTSP